MSWDGFYMVLVGLSQFYDQIAKITKIMKNPVFEAPGYIYIYIYILVWTRHKPVTEFHCA